MVPIVFSLLGGILLALLVLGLILHDVRTILRKRSYSPWRGIITREGIAGTWLFILLRYGRMKPNVFMIAFVASYFALTVFFAHCFFREAEYHGRGT
ncbi:MAG: hypothetical protein ABDK87_03810 [Atribacterota bacterium]